MTENTDQQTIRLTIFYFFFSALITWWFIEVSSVYESLTQKLLSCGIAGAKWGIQIVAAFLFLKNKKWEFLKVIGFTCLIGSLILLPFAVSSSFGIFSDSSFFMGSLVLSIVVMIVLYFIGVKKTEVGGHWWAGWLLSLAIAITLQLKVVFNLNLFQE